MKKAFIIPNQTKDPELSVTARVIEKLQSLGLNCRVDARYKKQLPFAESFGENPEVDCDLIVVVGGDGSFLDASVIAIEMDIPIVGVNLGKVGYLAQIDPDGLDNFDKLSDGNYTVENKMLLEVCGADGNVDKRRTAAECHITDMCDGRRNLNGVYYGICVKGTVADGRHDFT